MKICPYCKGEVPKAAIKCRHCGEFLEKPPGRPGPQFATEMQGKSSNSLATVALVMGIIGLCFPLLSIVALICGIIGLSNAGKHPAKPGQGPALAGIILGALGIVMIPIMAAIAIPTLLESRKTANEAMAVSSLRALSSAQELYYTRHASYGSMEDLLQKTLVDMRLGKATPGGTPRSGYFFTVRAKEHEWSATAVPSHPGATGGRSFFIDQTGIIYYKPCKTPNDTPASSADPPLGR
jgi:type II secretory pathway pseudopilin PulG